MELKWASVQSSQLNFSSGSGQKKKGLFTQHRPVYFFPLTPASTEFMVLLSKVAKWYFGTIGHRSALSHRPMTDGWRVSEASNDITDGIMINQKNLKVESKCTLFFYYKNNFIRTLWNGYNILYHEIYLFYMWKRWWYILNMFCLKARANKRRNKQLWRHSSSFTQTQV